MRYSITVAAGLATFPIETVRMRMLMNPGGYPDPVACAQSVLAEGAENLFLGAGYTVWAGFFGAMKMGLGIDHRHIRAMYITAVHPRQPGDV